MNNTPENSQDESDFINNAKKNYQLYLTDGETNDKLSYLSVLNNSMDIFDTALEAIKNNDLAKLSETIRYSEQGELFKITQVDINKLFAEAWRIQNIEAAQYLSIPNSSKLIADPHFGDESVAKHLCIDGNLPALQLFMEMHEPDLSSKGRVHKLDMMCFLSDMSFINLIFYIDAPPQSLYDVFTYAVKHNHIHIMDYLSQYVSIDYQTSLEVAATQNKVAAFEYLLQKSPLDLDYERILILSIGSKHEQIAKILIDKNLTDINGMIMVEREDTMAYFANIYPILSTSNSAPVNNSPAPKIQYKYSALSLACTNDNLEFIDYLMAHNADIFAHNALALSEIRNIDTAKHLILQHNLPNNLAVNKVLHEKFSTTDYTYLVHSLESRDLANELQHDLPITSNYKPKSKV